MKKMNFISFMMTAIVFAASFQTISAQSKDSDMNIKITFNGQTVTASLEDNGAARDLYSRLPLTVTISDFNSTEKIFYPKPELSLKDTPKGCAPERGDITIYEPWGNVAIFYREWSHSRSLIKIGRIDGNGIDTLSSQNGNFEAVIEKR